MPAATGSRAPTARAGNANAAATGQTAYTIDNPPPTVNLTDDHPDSIVRDADTVEITATFTENDQLSGTTPTITITNGGVAAEDMTATGDPLIWTFIWNVPAGNAAAAGSGSPTDRAGQAHAPAAGPAAAPTE